jgi:hypothetical protein
VAEIHPLVDRVAEFGSLEGHVLKQDDLLFDCCDRAQQSKRRRSAGIIDGNSCRQSGEQRWGSHAVLRSDLRAGSPLDNLPKRS